MQKKTIVALITCMLSISISFAQGIRFGNFSSWQSVLSQAKKENKYIFIDCYATWCGPCKEMEREVFNQKSVGDFLNDQFISVRIQFDSTANDNPNTKAWFRIARKFEKQFVINAYPTYLFFNTEGNIVAKEVGALKPIELFLEKARLALNPDSQYYPLKERFVKGDKSVKLIKTLVPMAVDHQDIGLARLGHDIFVENIDSPFLKKNLLAICASISNIKSKGFKIILNQSKKVDSILEDEGRAESLIVTWVCDSMYRSFLRPNIPFKDWNSILIELKKITPQFADKIFLDLKINDASAEKRWEDYGKFKMDYYDLYASSFSHNEQWFMNNDLWDVFLKCNDQQTLTRASKWSKVTITIYNPDEEDPASIDTYANLLFKSGKVDDAIFWENKALKMHVKSGNEPKAKKFAETLKKMKDGTSTWSKPSNKN